MKFLISFADNSIKGEKKEDLHLFYTGYVAYITNCHHVSIQILNTCTETKITICIMWYRLKSTLIPPTFSHINFLTCNFRVHSKFKWQIAVIFFRGLKRAWPEEMVKFFSPLSLSITKVLTFYNSASLVHRSDYNYQYASPTPSNED